MPHHGNEEEHNTSPGEDRHQEPVIRDNRKVDPVTGQAGTRKANQPVRLTPRPDLARRTSPSTPTAMHSPRPRKS
ncbi:Protein GrpE [Arthrobacter sp. Hiyo4]|nr:Protein GrpE [Arthrobacter sp. Hiyo4]